MNNNDLYATLQIHINSINKLMKNFPSLLWDITDMKYCVQTLRNYLQNCYDKKEMVSLDEYDFQFVAEISHKISKFLSSYGSQQSPGLNLMAEASDITGQIKKYLCKIGLISKAELTIDDLNASMQQQLRKINKSQKDVQQSQTELSKNLEKIQKISIEQETKAKSFEESFDNSKKIVAQFRDEVNNLRTRLEAERNEYVEISKKELAKLHEDFEHDLHRIVTTSESFYLELENKNKKADILIGALSEKAVVSDFGKIAERERTVGNYFRWGALGAMLVLAIVAVCVFWGILRNGNQQKDSKGNVVVPTQCGTAELVLRSLTILAFAIPVWYCVSESNKHMRIAHRNKRIQLELAALRPYLKDLDDEKLAKKVMSEIAGKYFAGNDKSDDDGKAVNIKKILNSEAWQILREAINLASGKQVKDASE